MLSRIYEMMSVYDMTEGEMLEYVVYALEEAAANPSTTIDEDSFMDRLNAYVIRSIGDEGDEDDDGDFDETNFNPYIGSDDYGPDSFGEEDAY